MGVISLLPSPSVLTIPGQRRPGETAEATMRVGIDIQHLRMERRGIYHYIWNILEHLRGFDDLPLRLLLYGDSWMDDPALVERLTRTFAPAQLVHHWDAPSLHLLGQHAGNRLLSLAPGLVRLIDQHLLFPLWQFKAGRSHGTLRSPRHRGAWFPHRPFPAMDVVHHTAGLLQPTARHANVLTIHDLIPFHQPEKYPGGVWMFMDSYRHAADMDMILTYSEYTRQDVIESLGVPVDNVRMVPLAAHEDYRPVTDGDKIRAARAKYGLGQQPYFLTIGFIEERKNYKRLIEAFLRLKQEEPHQPHQLVLIGDGPRKDLEVQIHAMHLTPYVKCLGFVPTADMPALMSGAEAFVFPSLYEGFGLPPLEAMACGAPVIASNVTSVPEVVGSAGLLIDPRKVDDLTAAMYRVTTNASLRARLRAQSLQRARDFSWDKTARLTRDAYAEALRRYRRKDPVKQRQNIPTTYRRIMREFMIQQRAALYLEFGVSIDIWPF